MWESVNNVIDLIIPFIVLALVSVAADRVITIFEKIMHRIPKLPDKFEPWFAYLAVVGLGFIFCWQGHWDIFKYLDVRWNYEWQGWIASSMVVSGGKRFLTSAFDMIEKIPYSISGVRSSVKNINSEINDTVNTMGNFNNNNNINTSQLNDNIVELEEGRYSNNI